MQEKFVVIGVKEGKRDQFEARHYRILRGHTAKPS